MEAESRDNKLSVSTEDSLVFLCFLGATASEVRENGVSGVVG
uniref:Uncharacterized protein n=1 Tax=Meloidogyne floridensis TaxID=298350 RepID=A0A915P440_9BILA